MKLSKTTESILQLTRELIGYPSRGGIDDPETILRFVSNWYEQEGMPGKLILDDAGKPCAFYAETGKSGPLYILDACIDTADTGDMQSWTYPPFEAVIDDGWLYGRGAGDSKMAVSLFSHLFRDVAKRGGPVAGRLGVLFDADEHTGRFGGVRAMLKEEQDMAGVCIGYPGMDELVIGARGLYRVQVTLPGKAGHTGMPSGSVKNAVRDGAELIGSLYQAWNGFRDQLPPDADFPFGPGMTVTEIHGGTAFSVIPDICTIKIDFRLTHLSRSADIQKFLGGVLEAFPESRMEEIDTWPAYTLPLDHPLADGLSQAVTTETGRELPRIYCGPSNIGNYLASFNIPATCGFGVICENFHAADERIRIDTIDPVYKTYAKLIDILID